MITLHIISRPELNIDHLKFLEENGCEWIHDGSASPAELLVEFSGRVCYMAFGAGKQSPRNNSEYIKNLIDSGHHSVLEHANWSFVISGVSRSFTHQLVRHRVGFSYSQLSQQYHDESAAGFIVPPEIERNPQALQIWHEFATQIKDSYQRILCTIAAHDSFSAKEKSRAIRSAARSIMPNATETKIVVTANARALRHFLSVRGAIEGDYEMRAVSTLILRTIGSEAPAIFTDFEILEALDGAPMVCRQGSYEF